MAFMHFLNFGKKKANDDEKIIIHLEHSVFESGITEELEGLIAKALKDGTLSRTTFIPPSPISINISTGEGTPMPGQMSIDILNDMCNAILKRLQDNSDE